MTRRENRVYQELTRLLTIAYQKTGEAVEDDKDRETSEGSSVPLKSKSRGLVREWQSPLGRTRLTRPVGNLQPMATMVRSAMQKATDAIQRGEWMEAAKRIEEIRVWAKPEDEEITRFRAMCLIAIALQKEKNQMVKCWRSC